MIDSSVALDVNFKNVAATLDVNAKIEMANYSDNLTFSNSSADIIEVTFTKALNAIFVYLPTPSSTANPITSMTITNTAGATLVYNNFIDGTQGLTQSGFISWDVGLDNSVPSALTAGQTFTYTFTYGNGIEATFGGINILFCDKFDLLREFPDLDNLMGLTSEIMIDSRLIRMMESTRNEIEKKVKNSNIYKEDVQYFRTTVELDRWDLLQIYEINQACIFWTLGKIFYFLQDSPGDIYGSKAIDYTARGESAFESINLSIDFNDNGALDIFQGERQYDNIEITFER